VVDSHNTVVTISMANPASKPYWEREDIELPLSQIRATLGSSNPHPNPLPIYRLLDKNDIVKNITLGVFAPSGFQNDKPKLPFEDTIGVTFNNLGDVRKIRYEIAKTPRTLALKFVDNANAKKAFSVVFNG
jgi:hypothetical protein